MKKKNPTDATTRNVRASKKRDAKIEVEIHEIKERLKKIEKILKQVMG